jgi:2-amino-4-hydroxy-6-hydroxymethyldihydropteridine diphosphokinase
MNFLSDNTSGAAPEVMDAVARANAGTESSYGGDAITQRLKQKFSDLFEREVVVHPVLTGTAANALSIATLSPPYGAVLCHAGAHIHVDECGAPEFYAGAKLVPVEGAAGKVSPEGLKAALGHFQRGFVHHVQPAAISLTQATELGTVYSPGEIAAISELARQQHMTLHMDGARFANAVAGMTPRPDETPESLLRRLQEIEVEFGRRPKLVLNEARPLDLDLIYWSGEIRSTPALTLPHPRAHLRRFVLAPLAELAPALVLSGQSQSVAELLESAPPDPDLRRLPSGEFAR